MAKKKQSTPHSVKRLAGKGKTHVQQLDPGWYSATTNGTFVGWVQAGPLNNNYQNEVWYLFPSLQGVDTVRFEKLSSAPADPLKSPTGKDVGQIWSLDCWLVHQSTATGKGSSPRGARMPTVKNR